MSTAHVPKVKPIEQRIREAREAWPIALLLFRAGDFYEAFEHDATTLARVLGLSMVTRDESLLMCGFPARSLDAYRAKLDRAGYQVVVIE